jgi:DNA helicase HerA-like ATPase
MRLKLLDPHLKFFFSREDLVATTDPLVPLVHKWLGGDRPISVLDLSGVPSDVTDLSVGLILQLIFEIAIRSLTSGIGRPSPVLVVLEEAHRYLGDSNNVRLAKEAVNRIAREGRKYGIGIMLVTQRPSDLPDTALSQVGTVIALRLTNAADQGTVRKALPDIVAGLADVLPSLRTGEAIVSGEAVTLPTRTLMDVPDPWPAAEDPSLAAWRRPPKSINLAPSIASWRGISED